MLVVWISGAVAAGSVGVAAWYLLKRGQGVAFANPREEELTQQVARAVGCTIAQALPFVRREIDLAPSQPDGVLVKRAAYHYRQELPEASCQVYRDTAPG